MALVKEIRIRARQVVPLVLAVCTLAYLAYHALHGDRGFLAWLILKQDLAEAELLRDDLQRQRMALAHRVGLLRPDSLDPDMLEERARMLLNYGHRDDRVILLERRETVEEGGKNLLN